MKIRTYLLALIMVLTASFTQTAYASTAGMTYEQKQMRAQQIQQRVKEIKAMNFSTLSTSERKELRHELKDMKNDMRDPVLIISGGALILIIILLILLL